LSDAALFRALADPTRLRILCLLRRGELCVGDLVGVLRTPQAKTSRHLATLRRAQLVDVRESGRWCFYSLRPARRALQRRLIDCLDAVASTADARRLALRRRRGGCCP